MPRTTVMIQTEREPTPDELEGLTEWFFDDVLQIARTKSVLIVAPAPDTSSRVIHEVREHPEPED